MSVNSLLTLQRYSLFLLYVDYFKRIKIRRTHMCPIYEPGFTWLQKSSNDNYPWTPLRGEHTQLPFWKLLPFPGSYARETRWFLWQWIRLRLDLSSQKNRYHFLLPVPHRQSLCCDWLSPKVTHQMRVCTSADPWCLPEKGWDLLEATAIIISFLCWGHINTSLH